MSAPQPAWVVLATTLSAGLLGAAVSVLAILTHRDATEVRDLLVPWGLVLATVASLLPSLALVVVGAARSAVAAYGAVWCLVLIVLLNGRAEGDYLVAGDARGWTFMVVGSVAVLAVTLRGMTAAPTASGSARATRRAARADPDDLARRRP